MTWKSYAIVSGAGLLATYLASPPRLPDREAQTPVVQNAATASSLPDADIVREAARLEGRLRAEAAFRAPARNPFRFGEEHAAARRVANQTPPAIEPPAGAAPAQPEPPLIVLSGIGTDVVNGVPERTAVLTTASGVVLARVGDDVGSEYRVRAIQEDAIELESTSDGSIRQLRFPVRD